MLNKYRMAALPFAMLDRLGLAVRPSRPVAYVVERANWATRWDGNYVCRNVERIRPGTAELVERPHHLSGRLVHFFSHYQWNAWGRWLANSNRYAVTFYHGKPEDDLYTARQIDALLASARRIDRIVTAASMIEERLLAWGLPSEKLVRIPIPIDLELFHPATAAQRAAARARAGVSADHIVIGSFQKDGVGWGDGEEPKLIKGPDVLVDVVARVAKVRPVFVLLTGPARGYVKRRLANLGIPFAHDFVEDYETLPQRYAALDVYLNPSREEGGPKGILEAMASGVPVVSTRVGMAPDVIRHGETGFIAEPTDVETLVKSIFDIVAEATLRDCLVTEARKAVQVCDARRVGVQHWEMVVKPILEQMGRL